jgi:hypothetical protein
MDNLHDRLARAAFARRGDDEARTCRYQDASRERLLRILKTKLKTTFVGDLARVETFLGPLWGHGKDPSLLSPEELYWRERWETLRTEILNNGNHQIRAVESELAQHTVSWDRHRIELRP